MNEHKDIGVNKPEGGSGIGPSEDTNETTEAQVNDKGVLRVLCPLCYDFFCEPVTLPCGHTFCRDCLITFGDRTCTLKQCPKQGCRGRIDIPCDAFAPNTTLMFLLHKDGMLRTSEASEDHIMQTFTNFSVDDRTVNELDKLICWLINQRVEIKSQCTFNKFGLPPLHNLEEGDYARRLAVLENERTRLYAQQFFGVNQSDGPKVDSYNLILVDGLPWDDMDTYYEKKRKVQNIPFYGMAATNSILLVGAPSSHIHAAKEMLDTWGFPFQCVVFHMHIVEVEEFKKQPKSFSTDVVQYYLAGSTGAPSCLRPFKQSKRVKIVRANLSVEKPVEFYKQIQHVFHCDYKLEVFSKTNRAGWHNALPDFLIDLLI